MVLTRCRNGLNYLTPYGLPTEDRFTTFFLKGLKECEGDSMAPVSRILKRYLNIERLHSTAVWKSNSANSLCYFFGYFHVC